jgi:hypothetical protein
MKQGPTEALEYIKNAFFGLFDSIKDKFFGFINMIKEGWDKVKGFFGAIKDKVVNFVTKEETDNSSGTAVESRPVPVKDMILTPDKKYSTDPKDFIMAMKNPADLLESLIRFLSGPQLQPAYAGAGDGSLMKNAMNAAAAQNTYNNSNTSNVSNITAPINVNVNANGMSPEMASAAVKRGVEDALKDAFEGVRGTITSPEARRY